MSARRAPSGTARVLAAAGLIVALVLASACSDAPRLVVPFDPAAAEAQLPTVMAALRDRDPGLALAELDRLGAAGGLPDGAETVRGLALLDAGRFDEARAALERELAAHPGDATAHTLLARMLIDEGRLDESAAHLDEARQLAPGLQPALLQSGRLALLRNDDERAQRFYRDALSRDPYGEPAVEAHTALGQIAARRGPEAAADAQAHAETAANLRRLHDYLTSYEARLRQDPADAEASYGVATAYLSLYVNMGGDPRLLQQAEKALAHVLGLTPDDARALYNLGFVRAEQGRLDEALELSRRAVASNDGYSPAHLNLGLLLTRLGRADDALAEFERALEVAQAPEDALRARFELVRCLAARSQPDDWSRALQAGASLLDQDPDGRLGIRPLIESLKRRLEAPSPPAPQPTPEPAPTPAPADADGAGAGGQRRSLD